jgi:hypothetical protein
MRSTRVTHNRRMHNWRRLSRPAPAPVHITAVEAMLIDGGGDRAFGASHGELLTPSAPVPPPPEPFVIEPPDWAAEAEQRQPEAEPMDALTAMKLAEHDEPEPPDLRPPEVLQPLLPVAIPAPNWRQEERELAQRERKPVQLDESPKSLQARPA